MRRRTRDLMQAGALPEAHAEAGALFRACGHADMQAQAVESLLLLAQVHLDARNLTGAMPYLLSCLLHAGGLDGFETHSSTLPLPSGSFPAPMLNWLSRPCICAAAGNQDLLAAEVLLLLGHTWLQLSPTLLVQVKPQGCAG